MFFRKVMLCVCFTLSVISISQLQAQRSNLDPVLAPFYHGVASGDPTANSVIIWTRVTTTDPSATVTYLFCEDQNLTTNCRTNTVTTNVMADFTVKVTVDNLNPNTYYYYAFADAATGSNSVVGRTKTLPDGTGVSSVRMAIASCSSYAHGYFHAYDDLKNRNDFDVILHLGDYIYEYGSGEYGDVFDYQPANEITTLSDYRTRFSFYRLDADLRELHQQYPFINIWDDHESTNDSWRDGAENHTPEVEGDWAERKSWSKQAYEEWLPVSSVNPLYRSFQFGDLLDLLMLDTRLEDRDEQLSSPTPANDQGTRNLLGTSQKSFLNNGLINSTATWKFVGQQVMFAPLNASSLPVNMDQWDGYASERQDIINTVVSNNIDNFVVLTGDIHTSWANEIPDKATTFAPDVYSCDGTLPLFTTKSIGTEFVATSVTSPGLPEVTSLGGSAAIAAGNPHMRYIDLDRKGYLMMDITPTKVQGDWFYVSDITQATYTSNGTESWFVNAGEVCLQAAASPIPSPTDRTSVPQPSPEPFGGQVLPVELTVFRGWNEGDLNQLAWTTQSEINNAYFELQRSEDGKTFDFLAKIAGNGTTSTTVDYAFTDKNPHTGLNYYRLKQVDLEGAFTYSSIISIQNNGQQKAALFFPNPCENQFFCTLNVDVSETILIEIIDQTGKILFEKEAFLEAGFQKIEMNLKDLPNGVHLVRLRHLSNDDVEQSVFLKM